MDRAAQLQILATSIRDNVTRIAQILEEVNAGFVERTYPRALERAFRAIEHDARVLELGRLADLAADGKELSHAVLEHERLPGIAELLNEVAAELRAVADDLSGHRRHRLDEDLVRRTRARVAEARTLKNAG